MLAYMVAPRPFPNDTYKTCAELSDSNIWMPTMCKSPWYPTVGKHEVHASNLKKFKM